MHSARLPRLLYHAFAVAAAEFVRRPASDTFGRPDHTNTEGPAPARLYLQRSVPLKQVEVLELALIVTLHRLTATIA